MRNSLFVQNCRMRGLLFCLMLLSATASWASHALSIWGDVQYPAGFPHFDNVTPGAPKGGEMVLVSDSRSSTFDKYNPFSLRGSAPAYIDSLMFDTLLTGSPSEFGVGYCLLAQDVELAPDRMAVVFRLNPAARFNNGDPVTATDVKYSFDSLTGKYAAPQYRSLFADVKSPQILDERTIRFEFKRFNRELPLTVGGLPVFSHKWGAGKPFDQITTEPPIASGPYKIGPVVFGRDITYVRDPSYWARDLNVRRGQYNFDRITVKIYRDNTAKLEAFKAGEFDLIQEFISRDWVRAYTGKRFDSGELVKRLLPDNAPHGFQVHVFNLRRPKFQDIRARKAINLAFDFEWMNRQLFYGLYKRLKGYFGGSEYEALGTPGTDELALLEPFRSQLPPEVFGPVAYPPSTDPPRSLRGNLREAKALLHEAGWDYRDGALRNAQGEAFVIDYVDSNESGIRTIAPWMRNLEKLGIQLNFRTVDFSIYQQRLRTFDFDMTGIRMAGITVPGNEMFDLFGSKAAKIEESNNLWGLESPVVDALLEKMVTAQKRSDADAAGKALDRVLIHGWYSVPQWYSASYRVAYDSRKFVQPPVLPKYFTPEAWAMSTWWAKP